MKRIIITLFLLLFCLNSIFSQEAEQEEKQKSRGFTRLTEQDTFLPISSLEWGHPDRFSFTSRLIHSFHKERKRITWRNNAGIFLSPGISGGRIGIDYLGIYSPSHPNLQEFALFFDLRGVIVRTWGNPLTTEKNTTLVGLEFKLCISFLLSTTIGYYSPISNEDLESFLGFHFGVGI